MSVLFNDLILFSSGQETETYILSDTIHLSEYTGI